MEFLGSCVTPLCWVYFIVSRGASYSIGQLDHCELDRHLTFPHRVHS